MKLNSGFFSNKELEDEQLLYNQYSAYRALLEKMHCAVVEYDIAQDSISANRTFIEKFIGHQPETGPLTMKRVREIHPEFNFKELDDGIQYVLNNNKSCIFETAITLTGEKIYWVELTLIPQRDCDGNIYKILAAIIDTTREHESDDNAEMISNIPNGVHRCYLSQPIHMEFASKGMCDMLGYTEAELNEKLTPDRKLSRLVHPDDLDGFINFARTSAKNEGRYRYEYRMQKKDGSYISVLDYMEVKRAASGILYGYSSVTDLTDYQKTVEEKHNKKVAELEEELKNAQLKNSLSQMQPHFLYNALASIREIVLEDPQYASDLIFDFSTHLRACIRAMSNNDLVPFSQELDNVNAYINIEKMRFGDKLRTKFEIDDWDFEIVPLSIQPLVENAIRHGIYERGARGGTLSLVTELTDKYHIIRVIDDGIGFDYEQIKRETTEHKRDSTGLCNLIFRLKKIMDARIDVDSVPGQGTVVTVSIPRKEGE